MEKFVIENCMDEIEIEVDFDYQPEEAQTRHYPGCSAEAEITKVERVDNGAELCLLPDVQEELEHVLCERAEEYRQERISYLKYGYMLEDY